MLIAPMVPAPSPPRPCSKSTTYIDFVNLLLLVLFTNLILALGVALCLVSKPFEAATMADLLARSASLRSRLFISDLTFFSRFTFILWSVTLAAFFGICLAFGLGRSEFSNKKGD
ncbi:hypothetical protein V1520DRAFT_370033 [Lipomyces starkeyi]